MTRAPIGLVPVQIDVLKMLQVELREAKAGRFRLEPNRNGVDLDLVEMLKMTVAEIKRLRRIEVAS